MAGLILLGAAAAWFIVFIAPEQATRFEREMRQALAADDPARAYGRIRYAAALQPTEQRLVDAGSLAYVHGDFAAAQSYFSRLKRTPDSELRRQALVGTAAAAAARGDAETFAELVEPASGSEEARLILAHAALTSDRPDLIKDIAPQQPANQTEAYVSAAAALPDDGARAKQALQNVAGFREWDTDRPYQRFASTVTYVKRDDYFDLVRSVETGSVLSGKASRQVVLAQALSRAGRYRAAQALAEGAVRDEPAYRDGWNALAAAALARQHWQSAERALNTSVKLDETAGYTWYLRAELAKARGDSELEAEYRDKARIYGFDTGSLDKTE